MRVFLTVVPESMNIWSLVSLQSVLSVFHFCWLHRQLPTNLFVLYHMLPYNQYFFLTLRLYKTSHTYLKLCNTIHFIHPCFLSIVILRCMHSKYLTRLSTSNLYLIYNGPKPTTPPLVSLLNNKVLISQRQSLLIFKSCITTIDVL